MNQPAARFYFDYVDPVSYLVELELREAEAATGVGVERVPFELRSPPHDMIDPEDPAWLERVDTAHRLATGLGLEIAQQALVPWTRKAHEFVRHAETHEVGRQAHDLLFEAVFTEKLDLGRVDVLVGLAVRLGLEASGSKAVLDVDRYTHEIEEARASATAAQVLHTPTLLAGGERLEGFHNRGVLGTFLHTTTGIT
ncbi:MAG: DsbA family oxidoreductase [Planctomycetota bacterium]|jgi:predicted DsbA family dithiol-disulfide isomerase